MIYVKDLIQLKRENVPQNKLDEFDWYGSLETELVEFGYMVYCTCGEGMMGSLVNGTWIKKHYEHRDLSGDSVVDWLNNYENQEHRN